MIRLTWNWPLAATLPLVLAAAAGCAAGARAGGSGTPALRFVSFLAPEYRAEFSYRQGARSASAGTATFGGGETAPHSAWLPLDAGAPVEIGVTLAGGGDAPLAAGRITIPDPRREWRYEAAVQLVRFIPGVPRVPCMGCFGEARFPVRPAAGLTTNDSLVVTWSARHATRAMPPA